MGTRSLTHFHQEGLDSPVFMTFYKQFDGYPSGLGEEIKECLGKRTLVNGFSDSLKQTNGITCAAALLVSHLKGEEAGGLYIQMPGSSDCGEEYTYDIFVHEEELYMQIIGYRGEVLGSGRIRDFDYKKLEKENEDDE